VLHWLPSLPSFERVKPLLVPGGAALVALIWAIAFATGSTNSAWDSEWSAPAAMRGKNVVVWDRNVEGIVESQAEREKRLRNNTAEVKEHIGDMKKKLLGDRTKMRGDAIKPEKEALPSELEFNPREACIQMKLQFPERYTDMDCMSERYDSTDPWWEN
jgi:hypothetical protein